MCAFAPHEVQFDYRSRAETYYVGTGCRGKDQRYTTAEQHQKHQKYL